MVKNIRAHGKQCGGCTKTHTDVMVSFQVDFDTGHLFAQLHDEPFRHEKNPEMTIHDLFLSKADAVRFRDELNKVLAHNDQD